jgi:hypothetical protein
MIREDVVDAVLDMATVKRLAVFGLEIITLIRFYGPQFGMSKPVLIARSPWSIL